MTAHTWNYRAYMTAHTWSRRHAHLLKRMHTPRATPDSKAPRRLGTSTNRFLIVCSTNQILCSVQQTRQAHRPVGSVQILDAQLGCPCVCVCALGQHRHVLYDSNEMFLLGTASEWCRACCVLAKEWMPRCSECWPATIHCMLYCHAAWLHAQAENAAALLHE